MDTGMLWFDNDPKVDLTTKISRAANYYQKKYGIHPNLCFVHPSMVQDQPENRNSIQVKTNQRILPNHLWIGIQDISNQV